MREFTDKEWEDWRQDPKTEAFVNRLRAMEFDLRISASKCIGMEEFHNATLLVGRAEGINKVIYEMEKRP